MARLGLCLVAKSNFNSSIDLHTQRQLMGKVKPTIPCFVPGCAGAKKATQAKAEEDLCLSYA